MASAGVSRTIDRLGRIVLPVEFRRVLGIGDHDLVEIALEGERIVMTKVATACIFCRSTIDLREHRGKRVCAPCITTLATGPRPGGAR